MSDGTPAAPVAAPAAAPAPTPAPSAAISTPAVASTSPIADKLYPPASTPSKDVSAQESAPEPEKPAATLLEGEKPPVAPEPPKPVEYVDFKFPEAFSPDADLMASVKDEAGKAGISQEALQALIDKVAPKWAEQVAAPQRAWQELQTQWAEQATNDPVYGGQKFAESKTYASRAFDEFIGPIGTPARDSWNTFLTMTGAGNHPEMFRVFAKIGAELASEGTVVAGAAPVKAANRKTAAEVLYPPR